MDKKVVKIKQYPYEYTAEINEILNNICFNVDNTRVMGSFGLNSQFFFSDIDLYEVVNCGRNCKDLVKKYKNIIKNIMKKTNYYVGDIKIGEDERIKIIDEFDDIDEFDYDKAERKYKSIENLLTKEEQLTFKKYFTKKPNNKMFMEMKKVLRFHILRWKPQDIMRGFITFKNKKIRLEEAIQTEGLFKMDIIVLLTSGVYQEISIIYDVRVNGVRVNPKKIDIMEHLKDDMEYLKEKKRWFKYCKRLFSYYRLKPASKKKYDILENLTKIFNSDLGILYQTINYMKTLIYLIDEKKDLEINEIRSFVDIFISKLSNVWNTKKITKNLFKKLHNILSLKDTENIGFKINKILEDLEDILNKETYPLVGDTFTN
jgi:hypothetical protein